MSNALVGMVDAHLKVDVGLLTAGGGVAGGCGVHWAQAEGSRHRVTPGSGRVALGLGVLGRQGCSLSFFCAFLAGGPQNQLGRCRDLWQSQGSTGEKSEGVFVHQNGSQNLPDEQRRGKRVIAIMDENHQKGTEERETAAPPSKNSETKCYPTAAWSDSMSQPLGLASYECDLDFIINIFMAF